MNRDVEETVAQPRQRRIQIASTTAPLLLRQVHANYDGGRYWVRFKIPKLLKFRQTFQTELTEEVTRQKKRKRDFELRDTCEGVANGNVASWR